jgi:dimeric dUTPase (all-alpha-NTP-PPase superfamily)
MKEQLITMLELQMKMDSSIKTDVPFSHRDYLRAACLEASEAIDHHGWKWWKHQKKNLAQLQMELIDIWHFYFSTYLYRDNLDISSAQKTLDYDLNNDNSKIMLDNKIYELLHMTILEKLDLLIGLSAVKRTEPIVLMSLCLDCELSPSEIFKQYVQKNTLNLFRQANGYNLGTYKKVWNDKEDNETLVELAAQLNSTDPLYSKKLWTLLDESYKKYN